MAERSVRKLVLPALEAELKKMKQGRPPVDQYGVTVAAAQNTIKELIRKWGLCGGCENSNCHIEQTWLQGQQRPIVGIGCDLQLEPRDNGLAQKMSCPSFLSLNSLQAYKEE